MFYKNRKNDTSYLKKIGIIGLFSNQNGSRITSSCLCAPLTGERRCENVFN